MSSPDDYLTAQETAEFITEQTGTYVSVEWVRVQRRTGRLPAQCLSPRKTRYRRGDILAFIERARVPAEAAS